jgi:ribonuclease HII
MCTISRLSTDGISIGMDEVGRGALAGPLVAAAVALSPRTTPPAGLRLTDSKLLTPEQRRAAATWIRLHAHTVLVESIDVDAINALGIGWANRAIFGLLMARLGRGRYLVDGNLNLHGLGGAGRQIVCLCDGDAQEPAIAAASIIAKVHRDDIMGTLHHAYPRYGWQRNAGYGTPEHQRALRDFGACSLHRTLFLRRLLEKDTVVSL